MLVVLLECQHTCMPQWATRDNTSSHNGAASTTPVTMNDELEVHEAVPSSDNDMDSIETYLAECRIASGLPIDSIHMGPA